MIHHMQLTIPVNTPRTALASVSLRVPVGYVIQEFLTFPDGCAGLVGCRVVMREHVIWPSSPDSWFINNNYTYSFADPLDLLVDSEVLRIEGYNEDKVFPHTLYFELVQKPLGSTDLASVLARVPVFASWDG